MPPDGPSEDPQATKEQTANRKKLEIEARDCGRIVHQPLAMLVPRPVALKGRQIAM